MAHCCTEAESVTPLSHSEWHFSRTCSCVSWSRPSTGAGACVFRGSISARVSSRRSRVVSILARLEVLVWLRELDVEDSAFAVWLANLVASRLWRAQSVVQCDDSSRVVLVAPHSE